MRAKIMKSPKYYGLRAGEVFELLQDTLKSRFETLRREGIASRLRVFGSVAKGTDRRWSDIDLLVDVPEITPHIHVRVEDVLSEGIAFPIHITLNDGKSVDELLFGEARDL